MSDSEGDYEYAYSSDEEQAYVPDDSSMNWEANPNAPPTQGKRQGFQFLTPQATKSGIRMQHVSQIRPLMEGLLKEVQEALGVSATAAPALLKTTQWSPDRLLTLYYENPDKLLHQAQVYHRCRPVSPIRTTDCPVCFDDELELLYMPCGHGICQGCWTDFLDNAVQEGPSVVHQTCPQASCKELITRDEFERVQSQALPKYDDFNLRFFCETNPLYRWCPGRGCEQVATASSLAVLESNPYTTCDSCSTSFCVRCGNEPHSPATCQNLTVWQEKCRNESETANWILANTKSCPKCSSRIEKNHGCNHMTWYVDVYRLSHARSVKSASMSFVGFAWGMYVFDIILLYTHAVFSGKTMAPTRVATTSVTSLKNARAQVPTTIPRPPGLNANSIVTYTTTNASTPTKTPSLLRPRVSSKLNLAWSNYRSPGTTGPKWSSSRVPTNNWSSVGAC